MQRYSSILVLFAIMMMLALCAALLYAPPEAAPSFNPLSPFSTPYSR